MGNCTVRGTTVGCSVRGTAVSCSSHRATAVAHVRVVVSSTGRVIEFEDPVTAGDVLVGFPRHGIFRQGDLSSPLLRHEQLRPNGRLYYLLPLERKRPARARELVELPDTDVSASSTEMDLPFSSGMVCEHVRSLEVLPPQTNGVWRVKLAIDAERLASILSEQVDAEALIERMRMLAITVETMPAHAKQGNGLGAPAAGWKAPAALPMASKVRPCERTYSDLSMERPCSEPVRLRSSRRPS
ncbi:hypothetical protein Taro_043613 [Colocasia esculenta]|uniref:Uncharacterized protein n=1 Tax=Colocasia esculenta TaxID=4460 RepID=A0A843WGW5_COLES|nr:hypothetical protein [Colocasia esculenta]